MKSEDRKKLAAAHKERTVTGGVCAIRNTVTGKMLLLSTPDVSGSRNRFEFARKTGSAVSLALQQDWRTYGADSFTFEVLEQLDKGRTQSDREFAEDLETLKAIWQEKCPAEKRY